MNHTQYIAALTYCYQVEAAGAIAGEVAMLLREDSMEKCKLNVIRRLEASNKILCRAALQQEGVAKPVVETSFYRNGIKLGQKFGDGDWRAFLNRFEATIHPEIFTAFLFDDEGNEIEHQYDGVDLDLLRHLVLHELALVDFIEAERRGCHEESTRSMEGVLESKMCTSLVGPEDPVGW